MTTPWYLEPSTYRSFVEQTSITEEEYVASIEEVLAVIPLSEAQKYVDDLLKRDGHLTGPFYIHPVPFNILIRHPLKMFLGASIGDFWALADVVKFGLDLLCTRDIPGVAAIRRDLRNQDQYVGRLFEIELLAELVRANAMPQIKGTPDFSGEIGGLKFLMEARHRGVAFPQAIVSQLTTSLGFKEFGELAVQLAPVGGKGELVSEVASSIGAQILSLIEHTGERSREISTGAFTIRHDPTGGPRSVTFSYGKGTYAEDLAVLVSSALIGKERQLQSSAHGNCVRIVALDLRALFPALPVENAKDATAPAWLGYYGQRIPEWRNAILGSCKDFLNSPTVVTGVLLWFRSPASVSWRDLNKYFLSTYSGILITRNGIVELSNAEEFRNAFASNFST